MKKALKYCLLFISLIVALVLLAGCGNKNIIATKSENDSELGNYEMKMEFSFKGEDVENIKTSLIFDDEAIAELVAEQGDIEFEKEGNAIVFELSAKEYEETYGTSYEKMTRDEIIDELEAEGYTIQK